MTQLTTSQGTRPAGCPMSALGKAYRPFEQEGAYRFFETARREEPVFYAPDMGYWVVTRRKDCLTILRDPSRFSASIALSPVTPFPEELVRFLQTSNFTIEPTQVNCDRPKHTHIRNIAGQYLNQKTYAALEPAIRRLVAEYLDRITADKAVDIVESLTYELPAQVVFLLLGITDVSPKKIKQWGDNRLLMTWGQLSPEELLDAGKELLDFWNFCRAIVDDRLNNPGDDYPSFLLKARNGNDEILTLNQIVCLVFGLLLAGHETTTNASSNILLELLSRREQWEKLTADPSLIPNAVEEGLRYASSVIAWRRLALEDVEIGGQKIPKGSNILVALGSANHDEDFFDNAETFDVARSNARDHIAFGNGIHFCIGAPLARIEIRVILEELVKRYPGMRLTAGQKLTWVRTISFRGPHRLLVDLTP